MKELLKWIDERMGALESHAPDANLRGCCPGLHERLGEVYLLRAEVMRRLEAEGAAE